MEPKAGKTTSEFALSLLALVVAGATMTLEFLGVGEGHIAAKITGLAAMALTALGYTWTRGALKATHVRAVLESADGGEDDESE